MFVKRNQLASPSHPACGGLRRHQRHKRKRRMLTITADEDRSEPIAGRMTVTVSTLGKL